MFLVRGDAAGGIVKAVGSALQYDSLKHMTQHVFQSFVAGKFGDREMYVLIVDQAFTGESVLYVAAVGIYLRPQGTECRIAEIRDGFTAKASSASRSS